MTQHGLLHKGCHISWLSWAHCYKQRIFCLDKWANLGYADVKLDITCMHAWPASTHYIYVYTTISMKISNIDVSGRIKWDIKPTWAQFCLSFSVTSNNLDSSLVSWWLSGGAAHVKRTLFKDLCTKQWHEWKMLEATAAATAKEKKLKVVFDEINERMNLFFWSRTKGLLFCRMRLMWHLQPSSQRISWKFTALWLYVEWIHTLSGSAVFKLICKL